MTSPATGRGDFPGASRSGPGAGVEAAGPWAAAGVALAAHAVLFPRVAALDSFYHVGHAAHYLETSPLDVAFPWGTQSVVRDVGADLWWGFHLLLVPFAGFGDPATGIRAAGVLFTLVLAGAVAWALRRHGVPGTAWWAALFLVAVPNVLYRYLMVRPHVLSLAAAVLLLSFLVRGRWWQVAASTAAIVWLHPSLFWTAPALLAAWAVGGALAPGVAGRPAGEASRSGRAARADLAPAAGGVLAGILAGWLLRPEPLGTAALVEVQLVRLFRERAAGLPMSLGVELAPLGAGELARASWLFLAAWAAAGALAVRERLRAPGRLSREGWTLLGAAWTVSAAYLVLSLVVARRAQVEWAAFGFLALPFAWRLAFEGAKAHRRRRIAGAVTALLLALHLPWTAHRHRLNVERVAFPPDLLRGASAWLARYARPGDVVFHARWDDFGPLLSRSRDLRYVNGMDPIFLFTHDAARYWEYFFLSADLTTEWTCDAFPCSAGKATDTHEAIRRHFGARWVVVDPRRNPRLSAHLRRAPGFRLGVDTRRELVFEVLGEAAGERGAEGGVKGGVEATGSDARPEAHG